MTDNTQAWVAQSEAARAAQPRLRSLSTAQKNAVLNDLAERLASSVEPILAANRQDMEGARAAGREAAFLDRLRLDAVRIEQLAAAVRVVAGLPDPVGQLRLERELAQGLRLTQVSVPIGVILMIYEARPNVTIDAFALCFKSGNAVLLKGGSDALATNRVLAGLIRASLQAAGVDPAVATLVDTPDREAVGMLLQQQASIDLVIPRGGYELVRAVTEQSRIPALYHADGIDHIYIDRSADLAQAIAVCLDAKCDRPATCNTVDTFLIDAALAPGFVAELGEALHQAGVVLYADEAVRAIIPDWIAGAPAFDREFLALAANLRLVNGVQEAIAHIARYGSRHTEAVLAEDDQVVQRFERAVDAATVCVNCSTRLHDGGVFGLGAEIGIATGKLHARGPVGLEQLCTGQWVLKGAGQRRGDH